MKETDPPVAMLVKDSFRVPFRSNLGSTLIVTQVPILTAGGSPLHGSLLNHQEFEFMTMG